MDHLSISESILRSLEAREKRRGGTQERRVEAAPRGPSTEDLLLAACARELERTVRDSVRTSFAHWEAGLIREVEGIARRVARSRESSAPEPLVPQPAAVAPAGKPAPRADGPSAAAPSASPPAAPRKAAGAPHDESWDDLVEAVKELRREWDQETFEKCFGDDSAPAEAIPQARPAPPLAAQAASPRREPEPIPREALGKKLDELIHLVKSSQPRETKPPPVSREVSSDIAREVVGRLKDSLATLGRSPGSAADKAPPPETRIPLDDISSMIDQVTGSARP
jgi:hypothetical protein